ncbi:MAG: hypothetical protein N4A35_10120 [Flavobacteriales bacterium]|jgi:hypothetical protein|nr:hypothetical protein [Flavobacteriales bacterium]
MEPVSNKQYSLKVSKDSFELSEELLNACFNKGDLLLLICMREESLLFKDEALELREKVPQELQEDGGVYEIVDWIDETRFKALSIITYSENAVERIVNAYKYFYSFSIGKIVCNVGDIFPNASSFFLPDYLCRNIINRNVINFCLVKGAEENTIYLTFKSSEQESLNIQEALRTSYEVEIWKDRLKRKNGMNS